jgi:CxxC motif-containing protein (DUF1111 family)
VADDAVARFRPFVYGKHHATPPQFQTPTISGAVMKRVIALLLCATIPFALFAGETGYKVTYDGGSLTDIKAGKSLRMTIEGNIIKFSDGKAGVASIPASAVTEISYGQDVHRRVGTAIAVGIASFGLGALTALSKSKKHFIGVTWADGEKKGGFAMQCDKNDYRGVLAGLEGVTGEKAVNSDMMNVKN